VEKSNNKEDLLCKKVFVAEFALVVFISATAFAEVTIEYWHTIMSLRLT